MSDDPAHITTESDALPAASENSVPRSFRRHPEVLARRDLGGTLLLTPQRSEPLLLEGIGALIWDLLNESTTAQRLASDLAEGFGRPEDDVARDINVLLEHLMIVGALCVG
jgi:hypothetical protein